MEVVNVDRWKINYIDEQFWSGLKVTSQKRLFNEAFVQFLSLPCVAEDSSKFNNWKIVVMQHMDVRGPFYSIHSHPVFDLENLVAIVLQQNDELALHVVNTLTDYILSIFKNSEEQYSLKIVSGFYTSTTIIADVAAVFVKLATYAISSKNIEAQQKLMDTCMTIFSHVDSMTCAASELLQFALIALIKMNLGMEQRKQVLNFTLTALKQLLQCPYYWKVCIVLLQYTQELCSESQSLAEDVSNTISKYLESALEAENLTPSLCYQFWKMLGVWGEWRIPFATNPPVNIVTKFLEAVDSHMIVPEDDLDALHYIIRKHELVDLYQNLEERMKNSKTMGTAILLVLSDFGNLDEVWHQFMEPSKMVSLALDYLQQPSPLQNESLERFRYLKKLCVKFLCTALSVGFTDDLEYVLGTDLMNTSYKILLDLLLDTDYTVLILSEWREATHKSRHGCKTPSIIIDILHHVTLAHSKIMFSGGMLQVYQKKAYREDQNIFDFYVKRLSKLLSTHAELFEPIGKYLVMRVVLNLRLLLLIDIPMNTVTSLKHLAARKVGFLQQCGKQLTSSFPELEEYVSTVSSREMEVQKNLTRQLLVSTINLLQFCKTVDWTDEFLKSLKVIVLTACVLKYSAPGAVSLIVAVLNALPNDKKCAWIVETFPVIQQALFSHDTATVETVMRELPRVRHSWDDSLASLPWVESIMTACQNSNVCLFSAGMVLLLFVKLQFKNKPVSSLKSMRESWIAVLPSVFQRVALQKSRIDGLGLRDFLEVFHHFFQSSHEKYFVQQATQIWPNVDKKSARKLFGILMFNSSLTSRTEALAQAFNRPFTRKRKRFNFETAVWTSDEEHEEPPPVYEDDSSDYDE